MAEVGRVIEKSRGHLNKTEAETETDRDRERQRDRPTPERSGHRQPPQHPPDCVVAKIHSLALLLDSDGLDAAIADLQQLQKEGQRERGRADKDAQRVRMRLVQTKQSGHREAQRGRWNGSKMFDSCPDMRCVSRARSPPSLPPSLPLSLWLAGL